MAIDWSEALNHPEAFPERPSEVRIVQTHISYVFVLDDVVYKIKKPVDFGFLDFTSVEKRRYFCEREVQLNKRLCPDIYIGVVPVVKTSGGYKIGNKGEVVDFAVKMKRMPEDGMMGRIIEKGNLTKKHIDLIVQALVPFYEKASTGEGVNEYGSIDTIRFNTEENFQQTAPYVGIAIPRYRYDFIINYTRNFLENQRGLFELRIKEGRIREGHGDLYSANICFNDLEGVYIFDCIEFNERFRCGDVASEVAFLAMDLDYHGQVDLSRYFVERFVELSGDRQLLEVLDFYKTYRAYVRGKIGCFTYSSPELPEQQRQRVLAEAKRYFNLAYSYAGGGPTIIVVFGLTGTGKTTISEALKKETLATHISTDRVRKSIVGVPPEERHLEDFEKGIYSPEMTERTYQRMLEEARKALVDGNDVILDGTYRSRRHRVAVLELASALGVRSIFVHCTAPEEEIKARLEKRLQDSGGASDARWETYLRMKERFEPPEEIPEEKIVRINTKAEIESLVNKVLSCLTQIPV